MFFDINMKAGKYNEFFVHLQPFPLHLAALSIGKFIYILYINVITTGADWF